MPVEHSSQQATKEGGSSISDQLEDNAIKELLELWQKSVDVAAPAKGWIDSTWSLLLLEVETSLIAMKRKVIFLALFVFIALFFFLAMFP